MANHNPPPGGETAAQPPDIAAIRARLAKYNEIYYHRYAHALATDVPVLLGEVERLRAELELAFSPGMYLEIQKVLDEALGTEESDGAGAGLVADVALLADRMRKAESEQGRLTRLLTELASAARAAEESLAMLVRDSVDPGTQALGDLYTLRQALISVSGLSARAKQDGGRS